MSIAFHDFVYQYCFWHLFASILYSSVGSNYLDHSISGIHNPFVSIFIHKVLVTNYSSPLIGGSASCVHHMIITRGSWKQATCGKYCRYGTKKQVPKWVHKEKANRQLSNRQQGVSGGTTPSSMGTPSATGTKAPVIDTESDDDVSFSVVDTRKMAPVDDTINNSQMKMDDMVPYHKFSKRMDQQVHDILRKKILHLPKDIINWSMNSITTKVVIRFKTRPYEVIKTLQFQQPYQNVVLA